MDMILLIVEVFLLVIQVFSDSTNDNWLTILPYVVDNLALNTCASILLVSYT